MSTILVNTAFSIPLVAMASSLIIYMLINEDGPFTLLYKLRVFVGSEIYDDSLPRLSNFPKSELLTGIFICGVCMSPWISVTLYALYSNLYLYNGNIGVIPHLIFSAFATNYLTIVLTKILNKES